MSRQPPPPGNARPTLQCPEKRCICAILNTPPPSCGLACLKQYMQLASGGETHLLPRWTSAWAGFVQEIGRGSRDVRVTTCKFLSMDKMHKEKPPSTCPWQQLLGPHLLPALPNPSIARNDKAQGYYHVQGKGRAEASLSRDSEWKTEVEVTRDGYPGGRGPDTLSCHP